MEALWLLALGALVYCFLVLIGTYRYLSVVPPAAPKRWPAVSVLKPLKGVDEGLEENLESFFRQEYAGEWEMLLAVESCEDPAWGVVKRLQEKYPEVEARVLIVGEPPWHNAKVWSLAQMTREAKHELVVMADSDIRVEAGMLEKVAGEFAGDEKLGVATCPYRAVGGSSVWSQMEALGMNTEFIAGVLVARMIEGMRFTLGPTVVARKAAIAAAGGWEELKDYLAEDFVLGQRVTERGWNSILSGCVVEHRIGSQGREANFRHRLRWYRSTRRSRPAGYVGQFFTNPLVVFLLLWPLADFQAAFLGVALMLRYTVGFATLNGVLNGGMGVREIWQLPVQDVLSFGFWVAGFFGRTIEWRGRRFELSGDGKFRLLPGE
ncbi:MAG: glycosyltransferase [Acidobacteriota bacterium]